MVTLAAQRLLFQTHYCRQSARLLTICIFMCDSCCTMAVITNTLLQAERKAFDYLHIYVWFMNE